MSYIDIGIVVTIALFSLYGLWKGIIRIIFSIIAMIVSVAAAYLYSSTIAEWLAKYIPWSHGARENVAFLLILVVVNRIVGLTFWIINKTVGFLWRLPFIGSLNHLLGLVFGLLEGVVVVGIVLAFLITNVRGGWFATQLSSSQITPLVAPLGAALLPGISGVMDTVQQIENRVPGIVTSTLSSVVPSLLP